jgi:hypothetical protein
MSAEIAAGNFSQLKRGVGGEAVSPDDTYAAKVAPFAARQFVRATRLC